MNHIHTTAPQPGQQSETVRKKEREKKREEKKKRKTKKGRKERKREKERGKRKGKEKKGPGIVAHTYSPSTLGGQGR